MSAGHVASACPTPGVAACYGCGQPGHLSRDVRSFLPIRIPDLLMFSALPLRPRPVTLAVRRVTFPPLAPLDPLRAVLVVPVVTPVTATDAVSPDTL